MVGINVNTIPFIHIRYGPYHQRKNTCLGAESPLLLLPPPPFPPPPSPPPPLGGGGGGPADLPLLGCGLLPGGLAALGGLTLLGGGGGWFGGGGTWFGGGFGGAAGGGGWTIGGWTKGIPPPPKVPIIISFVA